MVTNYLTKIWITLILALSTTLISASPLNGLSYMTEEYPPFNFTGSDKVLKGMSVEILLAIMKNQNASITKKDLKVVPWTRGYRQALKGPNMVLFSTTRTDKRESLFKWAGPIVPSVIAIIAHKKSNISINDPSELAKYSIGVVRDDVGEQLVRELNVFPDKNIKPQSKALNIIQQLKGSRIDLLAYEVNSLRYQIKELGLNNSDYLEVYTLNEGQLYFAFSPDVSDTTVTAMQTGLEAIKGNGEYEKILQSYR